MKKFYIERGKGYDNILSLYSCTVNYSAMRSYYYHYTTPITLIIHSEDEKNKNPLLYMQLLKKYCEK